MLEGAVCGECEWHTHIMSHRIFHGPCDEEDPFCEFEENEPDHICLKYSIAFGFK